LKLLEGIPDLRHILATDVRATYEGDPAARSHDEIIFSYPGIYAMTVYRVAHRLSELGVPLMPRIMTEWAHTVTGTDIHPGARIGRSFFIDHATGVVIYLLLLLFTIAQARGLCASGQRCLLGQLFSYCWLILEDTGGYSLGHSLVLLPPSSTLAGSSSPVLPQGACSGSSLAVVQPSIEGHSGRRTFRGTANRSSCGLAFVQPADTLDCGGGCLHPQVGGSLDQHRDLRHLVVVACQRHQRDTGERVNCPEQVLSRL
jgi:hypothetical protein